MALKCVILFIGRTVILWKKIEEKEEITRLKNKNIVFILDIIGLSIMCITLLIYSFSVKIVTCLALFDLNGGLIVYTVINYIKICKLLKNSNK